MTRNFEDERERWEYDFGRRLNMLRENAGMRYEDLAKAAGIGTTMTWRYLTGASEPTAYVLRNLALALGTSADVLLGLDLEEGDIDGD
ncbi:MAG: helix-turn-helix transcriptional regulator [Eggerthellaceae bacterium]|nr:helix-turn-helix transcriptional regulator [Eggerthellaceae bacterium]